MYEANEEMDPDLNRYDVNHVTVPHPRMTREEWEKAYDAAWDAYYSDVHVETVFRRCVATRSSPGKALFYLAWFRGSMAIERAHPAEGGMFRLKYRKDRRPTLPLESPLVFYPKYFVETGGKIAKWLRLWLRFYLIMRRVLADPKRYEYTDAAIDPIEDDEIQTHELFQTEAARAYVSKAAKINNIRGVDTVGS